MRGVIGILLVLALAANVAQAQDITKMDSNKPIEITADSLEVLQKDKQAVFKGNVVAKQGQINLKADTMTVFYRDSGSQNKEGNAISKILVDGDVFLATAEESAKGSKGVYNVDSKQIDLSGDVLLTRGQNVLKGNHLVYNLASGKSLLTGGGAGGIVEGEPTSGGRVRGLFVPKNASQ